MQVVAEVYSKQPVSLATFITLVGDQQAAILFEEKVRTIAGWRRGERYPSRRKFGKIIQRSKGRITWASLLAGTPCE